MTLPPSRQEPGGPVNQWSLKTPSARRSLVLCAAGALLGLIMAGVGLFTAKGTRTSGVPPEDVALVNGVPILMSDYIEQLRAVDDVSLSQASQQQKRAILSAMIREELFVQRGIELGLPTDSIEVRSALVSGVESMAAVEANMSSPIDSALRALYESHKDSYATDGTMTLGDYVSVTALSDATLKELRASGGDVDAAKRLGLVSSGAVDDGQEFYFAARIHLGDQLFQVARAMRPGQVSDPIQSGGKWHVLVMNQNSPPVAAPFAQVVDHVRNDYVSAQIQQLQARTEQFLRRRAEVSVQRGFE